MNPNPGGSGVTTPSPSPNGAVQDWPDPRRLTTEEQIMLLAWLHAELNHKNLLLARSVAALLAQQMQPSIQAQILERLQGG